MLIRNPEAVNCGRTLFEWTVDVAVLTTERNGPVRSTLGAVPAWTQPRGSTVTDSARKAT